MGTEKVEGRFHFGNFGNLGHLVRLAHLYSIILFISALVGSTDALGPMASSKSEWHGSALLTTEQVHTGMGGRLVASKTSSAPLPTNPARVVDLDTVSEEDYRDLADRATSLVNLARKRKGLGMLCVNSKLGGTTGEHTSEMAKLDVLQLAGLVNGSSTFTDRIQTVWGNWTFAGRAVARSNLVPLVQQDLIFSSKMPFVNRNRKLVGDMPLAGVPELVVASWLSSPSKLPPLDANPY
jgi:hypothetical protein